MRIVLFINYENQIPNPLMIFFTYCKSSQMQKQQKKTKNNNNKKKQNKKNMQ